MTVTPTHGTRIFMRYRPVLAPASPYVNSWLRIGEVSNFGEISQTFEELTFDAVSRKHTVIKTGRKQPVRIPLTIGYDHDDVGQTLLEDVVGDGQEYQFKITLPDIKTYTNESLQLVREYTRLGFRAEVSVLGFGLGGATDWLTRITNLLVPSGKIARVRAQKITSPPVIADEEEELDTAPLLEDPYYEDPEEE